MSDWERIFGAGYSAERLVERLNNSWFQTDDCGRYQMPKAHTPMAYHGDETFKTGALKELDQQQRKANVASGLDRPLLEVFGNADTYDVVQHRLGIPSELAELADDLCDTSDWGTSGPDGYEWIHNFLNATVPGSRLYRVGSQVMASIGRGIYDWLDESACEPALLIIEARARGVRVGKDTQETAATAAMAACFEWDGHGYIDTDLAIAALAEGARENLNGMCDYARRATLNADRRTPYNLESWRGALVRKLNSAPSYLDPEIDLGGLFSWSSSHTPMAEHEAPSEKEV